MVVYKPLNFLNQYKQVKLGLVKCNGKTTGIIVHKNIYILNILFQVKPVYADLLLLLYKFLYSITV